MKIYKLINKKNNNIIWALKKKDCFYNIKNPNFENTQYEEKLDLNEYYMTAPFFGSKILGFSLNYKSLIGDSNDEPLFFLKNPNSIITQGENIEVKKFNTKVWIEVELVVVVKDKCKNIEYQDVDQHILGYTIGNDVTSENLYGRDWHLGRGKGQDTFSPIAPFINEKIDTRNLNVQSFINDKLYQRGNTNEMLFDAKKCFELASKYCTLFPGDLIFTGTPVGATDAIIKKGDKVRIEIENLGFLENNVV